MMILYAFTRTSGYILLMVWILVLCLGQPLSGQQITPDPSTPTHHEFQTPALLMKLVPRIADPKLDGGEIPIHFLLQPAGKTYQVTIQILNGGQLYRDIFDGALQGSTSAYQFSWDGKDSLGNYADPGDYTVLIEAKHDLTHTAMRPVTIVRLGITEIRALPGLGFCEWQMVYFMKGSGYAFYATPAICEYANKARPGDISDLDLNDGAPRPPALLHEDTAEPVMDGSNYEEYCYNYPLCYRKGCSPVFDVIMGADCTSQQGSSIPCGYPVPGIQIRGLAVDDFGAWNCAADDISPGLQYRFTGPSLPTKATRSDRTVTWSWQYKKEGQTVWKDIQGNFKTEHRFYTTLGMPVWASGASGTQYSGPWVEVAQYFYEFAEALNFDTTDEAGVVKTLVRGYFGQEGPLPNAIEGVIYDTYTMGGDGGATHYYSSYTETISLTKLLNNHANGVYVNCSDVASSASVMIGMLGVKNIQMLRLGPMSLRAIWGIGCPEYTLSLWGGGSHSFSYHHIMTRDQAVHVSDACMWLDEDGDPDSLPGRPGYNHDRLWDGFGSGYNELSSTNNVSKTLNPLPEIN